MMRRTNEFGKWCATRMMFVVLCCCAPFSFAQGTQSTQSVVLDRVLVVVNRQPILESDLDRELKLTQLDPKEDGARKPSRQEALDRLISRALLRQQFALQPAIDQATLEKMVADRLIELRTELPVCVRAKCVTPEGWKKYLTESNLTAGDVEGFLRDQIEILDLIEKRFRPGIHITPEQVENYYKTILLPRYPNAATAPALESVATRIEEILLEQDVDLLLEEWLSTLRREGDVEFIDSTLESPSATPQLPVVPTEPVSGAEKQTGGKR